MQYPHPSLEEIRARLEELKGQLDFERKQRPSMFTKAELDLLSARLRYLAAAVNLWGAPIYPPTDLHHLLYTSKQIKIYGYEKKP